MSNVKHWFHNILKKDLLYKTNIKNSYDIPDLSNVSINISLKSAIENPKTIIYAFTMLKIISNQKPIICRAKKSIAVFKIRKGMIVGCKVNLRKNIAFNFLDSFILLSLGKVKDFKAPKINKNGILSVGITNPFIFPELANDYDKFPKNISSIINIRFLNTDYKLSKLVFTGLQIPID